MSGGGQVEGPFTHVIDCGTGNAIDWTQDEPERAAARDRERAELQAEQRLQDRASARQRLQRLAHAGTGAEPITRADLRDLIEVLG